MVLGQSMRVAAIGLFVGGGAAVVVSRVIQAEYHGIQGIDGAASEGPRRCSSGPAYRERRSALRASRWFPVEN